LRENFPEDEKTCFHFDPKHKEVYFIDKKTQKETADLCYINKFKAITQAESPAKSFPEQVTELQMPLVT
jgi:cell fate (sporulation/competence/biofilm development) regulator YmcA (YheA/YmcA/DUF963 family)